MKRNTSNAKARQFVERREPFQANNLHGEVVGNWYVVYSYRWYPIFAYCLVDENAQWFECADKYSSSTSKQTTQCRPSGKIVMITKETMRDLVHGI